MRKALRNWAFVLPGPDERNISDDVRNVLHCVSKTSRPLADLAEPATARAVLDSLKLKLDGTAAAAENVRRKRRTLVNTANYAVNLGELSENPITAVRWQKPKSPTRLTLALSRTPSRLESPGGRLLRGRLSAGSWSAPGGSLRLDAVRWSPAG